MVAFDRASARAIFIELGPDIGVFTSARHCAACAGLGPGNIKSAGNRRVDPTAWTAKKPAAA